MSKVIIDFQVSDGADVKSGRITAEGDSRIGDDIALAADAVNTHVVFGFNQADLASGALIFFCDRPCTVKTNSASDPDDTFAVAAGGFVNVPALSADITDLFVSNGDEDNAATLLIRGVRDITP